MNLHLPTFYDYVRRAPFGGGLTTEQVQGCDAIINAWRGPDDRHLAYILATAFHETAGTMAAVREGSTRTRRLTDSQARRVVAGRRYGRPDAATGHVFYGRGLVQLTWKSNYRKMGEVLGLDLVANPDLTLDLPTAVRILIEGMTNGETGVGDFTKKALEDYFNETTDDPVGARRIVNGTDKASLIASYHVAFLASIKEARKQAEKEAGVNAGFLPETQRPTVPPVQPDGADLKKDPTAIGGVLAGLGGLGGIAAAAGPILQGVTNVWALLALALVLIGAGLVLTGRVQLKIRGGV